VVDIPIWAPPFGSQMQLGYVKVSDFRAISLHVSGTVQYRNRVTTKVIGTRMHLLNGAIYKFKVTLSDPTP